MQIVHRYFKTWEKKIDVISPVSDFAASKMVYAGLKPNNIIVRKNYLKADPGEGSGRRSGAVFVGRLSPEKGLSTLMNAWEKLPDVPLKIIGTGPEEANIKEKSAKLQSRVTLSGQLPHSEMLAEVKESQFLVMPSVWYETFGRTIVEAYATGTPVIASRLGAIAELVEDGQTGLLFTAGDSDDLAEKVTWAIHHPEDMARMGKHARQVFLDKYEAGSAYQQLMAVYQAARTRTKN
ncbi:MAG: glycosyltransferase family 4 protein [Anaerolineaceae bacterium]|nr:glycosyltransferase family 4 protein [Anaerolineaceae bacterium]